MGTTQLSGNSTVYSECMCAVNSLMPYLPVAQTKELLRAGIEPTHSLTAARRDVSPLSPILPGDNKARWQNWVLYKGKINIKMYVVWEAIRKNCRGGTMNSSFYFGHIFELRPGRL